MRPRFLLLQLVLANALEERMADFPLCRLRPVFDLSQQRPARPRVAPPNLADIHTSR